MSDNNPKANTDTVQFMRAIKEELLWLPGSGQVCGNWKTRSRPGLTCTTCGTYVQHLTIGHSVRPNN